MQTSNTYDSFNRLTTRKFWDSILGNGTETFTYDANTTNYVSEGVLTNMQMVNGHTIVLTHDTLQRLQSRHINSGKDNGNGGMWEAFTYDGTQVETKGNWKSTASIDKIHEFTYKYDGNGNITEEITEDENNHITTTTYTYDRLNQLTGVAVNTDDDADAEYTEAYTYDTAGNLLTFSNGRGISHTYSYTYSNINEDGQPITADNQVITHPHSDWKDLLKMVNGQDIIYDAIGNPTKYYDGTAMTWAEGRRLQSLTRNGVTIHYQYNADGLRTKKISPDGSYTVYHIADGRYVGETRCYGNTVPYLYLRYTYNDVGSVCGFSLWNAGDTAWTEYYFATNLQGDVLQVYTAANDSTTGLPQLVADYTYDAWGNILSEGGALKDINPFRYRGYYFDEESDFYYLQSRYYDPEIGRFINVDEFVSTGQGILGYNMFAYCLNNPVCHVDMLGFISVKAAKQLIKDNAESIISAGDQYGVDPVVIAGCIYAEQVLNVDWKDTLTDLPLSFLDTSIGIGQIKISTAIKLEKLGYVDKKPYTNRFAIGIPYYQIISFRLIDKDTNIKHVAAYLKAWQDVWKNTLDISGMPGVLATLYNLGERSKLPNRSPKMNDFGRYVMDNYDMLKKLLGL